MQQGAAVIITLLVVLLSFCHGTKYYSQHLQGVKVTSVDSSILYLNDRDVLDTVLTLQEENITSITTNAYLGNTILATSYVKNDGRISAVYFEPSQPAYFKRTMLYSNLQHLPDSVVVDQQRARIYWTAHVPFEKGPSSMEYVPNAYTEFYSAPLQNINGTIITYRVLLTPYRGTALSNGFVPLSQISIDWTTGNLYMILDVYRKQVWKITQWLDIPQTNSLITLSTGIYLVIQPKNIPNKQAQDENNYISAIYANASLLLFGGHNYIFSYYKSVFRPGIGSIDNSFPRTVAVTPDDTKDLYTTVTKEDNGPSSRVCVTGSIYFQSCLIANPNLITSASAIDSKLLLVKCNKNNCDLSHGLCWNNKCECLQGYTGPDCSSVKNK